MMKFGFFLIPLFMCVSGCMMFVSKRKHLLNTLLSLEFIMLGIFWLLSLSLVKIGYDIYFVLFFLTFAACEGALGLSLLVSIVRTHGNDCFSNFGILQC
uniref:NADH dehydrogenase subunit 4L n=1 Tax=Anaspides clarkei TaxID=2043556 RepID=UPI002A7FCD42|nr:NADH dehydrogenase subunit 4L [Anaspides clarkei]YP_010988709.1 NADH dehydrogenase subunit 4L [Anaspides jarmani]WOR80923.1 NADH dehydrogenase subunit 4L [Anaspides clarkei]WOR81027.1 NADH dehydrogenase subunit 4L [Anaspides jarmani]WOR81040.1 NADH dehydrogenase subunit 4L [Anaspides jarmani]